MSSTSPTFFLQNALKSISKSLEKSGDASKKKWWENYVKTDVTLRDVANNRPKTQSRPTKLQFYGVPMAKIRFIVREHIEEIQRSEEVESQRKSQLPALAYNLMEYPVAEEKLAGILVLQENAMEDLTVEEDLERIGKLFGDGFIYDWNTTDWLCVRVLGPLMETKRYCNSQEVQETYRSWSFADNLWKKRASLVAFCNSKGKNITHITDIASRVVVDDRRFCQTAVGWSLRELSQQGEPGRQAVIDFIKRNREHMSNEAINMTTAKLRDKDRSELGITGKRRRR